MTLKTFLLVLFVLCVFLGCSSTAAKKSGGLGVTDGRLAPCPDSPNCVSSQAEDEAHRVAPLPLEDSPADAMDRIVSCLMATPRVTLVTRTDTYLHAEVRSALFRFVDDVEVSIDEAGQTIHFRSASRTGHSDLGVNRKRVERLKQKVLAR
ncbi:DUF1499 domain-containing protein [Desulfoluna spongiiphila]|uniref:Uncharacterized conserved protein, DUF1499 family n=1 Tax=Desulfoluna spongiiphila TaxID=419481 RepID=A0A1G5CZN2_9BACT|nr:DUF1499 domain-containing protein [Desulfoluna spongiiphila]SCY07874.1 Uncharacterized conserved protein, DUF1499 family [Desulfoluna spongiiphila]